MFLFPNNHNVQGTNLKTFSHHRDKVSHYQEIFYSWQENNYRRYYAVFEALVI